MASVSCKWTYGSEIWHSDARLLALLTALVTCRSRVDCWSRRICSSNKDREAVRWANLALTAYGKYWLAVTSIPHQKAKRSRPSLTLADQSGGAIARAARSRYRRTSIIRSANSHCVRWKTSAARTGSTTDVAAIADA